MQVTPKNFEDGIFYVHITQIGASELFIFANFPQNITDTSNKRILLYFIMQF
jgi:hypothetical protein